MSHVYNHYNLTDDLSEEEKEQVRLIRPVNNKWATVTFGEHSLRKIAALDLEHDDKLQVMQALEIFRLERAGETLQNGLTEQEKAEAVRDHLASDVREEVEE